MNAPVTRLSEIRPGGSRSLRNVLGALAIFATMTLLGREIVDGYTKRIIEILVATAVVALAMAQRGLLVGVLVLAAMNGVPLFDTSRPVVHHIAVQDLACMALIGTALVWGFAAGREAPNELARRLRFCGLALLAWCLFIVGRTWASGHAPLLGALREGRDFIYFAILLTVLPRVRFTPRELRGMLAVLVAGASAFAVGQILTVEKLANPTFIVHAVTVSQTLGTTRVYSQMIDLVFAGAAFGLAAVALGGQGLKRSVSVPVTALLVTSVALQLTRARWIALVFSFLLVSVWFGLQAQSRAAAMVRRRVPLVLGAITFVAIAALAFDPTLLTSGTVVKRILSVFSDISSSNTTTSTVAVRQQVASAMISLLGSHWLAGLGLIPPSAHFYVTLPNGALRNPDVGVMNAVMTIGVIGAALIYLPFLVVLRSSMRTARMHASDRMWLHYGGQIWIVASVGSSITLITLFSVSGLAISALILSMLAQPILVAEAEPVIDRLEPAPAGSGPLLGRYATEA